MAVEHHHIGTPPLEAEDSDWELVPHSTTGRIFLYSPSVGVSVWTLPGLSSGPLSIFEAALIGDLELIERYAAMKGKLDVHTEPERNTVMHYAVSVGKSEIVAYLLSRMDRPHRPNGDGVTPLSLACAYGHSAVAMQLISGGALLTAVDRQGDCCLHATARHAQTHTAQQLLSLITTERNKPLFGHLIWSKNILGQTCYDVAISAGFNDTAELILSFMRTNTRS